MTTIQKEKILQMRDEGIQYAEIANRLNLSVSAVKVFIARNKSVSNSKCKNCNTALKNSPQIKVKKFCSDKCRLAFWYQQNRSVAK